MQEHSNGVRKIMHRYLQTAVLQCIPHCGEACMEDTAKLPYLVFCVGRRKCATKKPFITERSRKAYSGKPALSERGQRLVHFIVENFSFFSALFKAALSHIKPTISILLVYQFN